MISSLQYCILCKQTGELSVYGYHRGGVCLFPDVSDHLVTSTQALLPLGLELLYYGGGGAVPARTIPPEGGLRSWPNERPGD